MSDSNVQSTPPKLTPTRRHHAARPESETAEDPDNLLATSIGGLNQKIEPYTKPIAALLIISTIAAIVWVLYRNEQTGARSDATLSLLQKVDSGDPELLSNVASDYPETVAAKWAMIFRGDDLLAAGLRDLYSDRDSAMEQIEEARVSYRTGIDAQGDRLLVSRAHLGLAKIAEAEGNLDEAITAYDEVVANAESDEMRTFAEQRIEFLKAPSTESFVEWFNVQDFSPADPSLPPSLPGMPDLPESSDLDLPKLEIPGGENSTIDPNSDQGMKLPEDLSIDDDADAMTEPAAAEPDASEQDASEPDATEPAAAEEATTEATSSETAPSGEDAVEAVTESATEAVETAIELNPADVSPATE